MAAAGSDSDEWEVVEEESAGMVVEEVIASNSAEISAHIGTATPSVSTADTATHIASSSSTLTQNHTANTATHTVSSSSSSPLIQNQAQTKQRLAVTKPLLPADGALQTKRKLKSRDHDARDTVLAKYKTLNSAAETTPSTKKTKKSVTPTRKDSVEDSILKSLQSKPFTTSTLAPGLKPTPLRDEFYDPDLGACIRFSNVSFRIVPAKAVKIPGSERFRA